MINLSKRLEVLAKYIEKDNKVIDIGCDHAYLDIYLKQKYPSIKIIASDINKNALNMAKENIKKNNLDIDTRLGNGLEVVNKEEIDTIVISGMGAHTIIGILYSNYEKLSSVKNIIIESNNDNYFIRKKITNLNYYIYKEELVKDKDIIYNVIFFKKGKKRYNQKSLYFGDTNDKLFYEKYNKELEKLLIIYKLIPKNKIIHKLKTKYKINLYKKILKKDK